MKEKKILPVLMATILTVAVVGCGNGNNTNSSTANNSNQSKTEASETGKINFNEEPYTIKMNYAVLGQEQPDLSKIEAKLNEVTLKEINAKVDLEGVSLYNTANVYALKASSGEKMDLMMLMPGSSYLSSFAGRKMIRPIDKEIAEWGPALKETAGDLLPAGQFKGEQYAVPQITSGKLTFGFTLNKNILDKYNIDITGVSSLDDMDAIFEKVHKSEPSLTLLAPEVSSSDMASFLVYFDGLGNTYGGLTDDSGTKVVNLFETEQWVNTAKKVREWYQKGYISKDVSTSQDDGGTLLDNGKVFATASGSIHFNGGATVPIPKRTIALHPPVLTTADSQLFLWAVSSSSERPDKAIQFLNLLNSSKELSTLLKYGIEGEHYELNKDGTVDTSKNENYRNDWLMFGNYNLMPLDSSFVQSSGISADKYRAREKEWNDKTEKSPGYGFMFDPTPVKTEVAALDAIVQQYRKVIGNGSVDTDELLKKFNDSLYAAGLQKVMDEKQRQFDEWLATKGK
ncbi:ABC transporter substrate-binding protein [Paenibacillus antibioticophila]|uniref:ABC transporter substrate-binding protein n=1 Tax=Paenibacillus antibioticophila TaxID=1274374 RepID=UPI0005C8DC2B|nr:ABC transporter substrate-binding protein [Paenibacillus antibioticophila]